MELLPTNFIHYLLEWIVNSRIHIMDFSIWSLQRCCRSVSSTCDSQMCVQSLLNLCEKIRAGDFNLIKWIDEVWHHCSIRTGTFYFRVEMIWSGIFDFRVEMIRDGTLYLHNEKVWRESTEIVFRWFQIFKSDATALLEWEDFHIFQYSTLI